MSPPQQLRQRTSNCSSLLIYRPQKDERLSWPSWLTYSGWLTHISGHPSATSRVQDSESTPAKDRCYTARPRNQPRSVHEQRMLTEVLKTVRLRDRTCSHLLSSASTSLLTTAGPASSMLPFTATASVFVSRQHIHKHLPTSTAVFPAVFTCYLYLSEVLSPMHFYAVAKSSWNYATFPYNIRLLINELYHSLTWKLSCYTNTETDVPEHQQRSLMVKTTFLSEKWRIQSTAVT